MPINAPVPCVLTIGGTDPSGGAGVAADARACAAFGAHALPIVTAVVAQNTGGVQTFEAVSPQLLKAQLDHLLNDITPQAVKTGLIPNAQAVEIIASRLKNLDVPLIIDPVFAPSTGHAFSDNETIAALTNVLLPLAELVTPNWLEAVSLNFGELETQAHITDWQNDAEYLAMKLHAILFDGQHPQYILLKGGDVQNTGESSDLLWGRKNFQWLTALRLANYEVRGTGCMLASAIAAQRAQGVPLPIAVSAAKQWITGQIENSRAIGKGRRVAV